MSKIIKTLGKHGFEINEYKGEFSLIATYEAGNGTDYQVWGKPKVSKTEYADKDRPFKIVLGDKAGVEKACLEILKEIMGVDYVKSGEGAPF